MTAEERPDALLAALRRLAPGTRLREGLDQILRARTGALIVVGDGPEVMELCSGGFELDVELTPAHLYELAKMDGAIILSSDARRIVRANVHLIPDRGCSPSRRASATAPPSGWPGRPAPWSSPSRSAAT